eukprot:1456788-Rhodomonas_salina.1
MGGRGGCGTDLGGLERRDQLQRRARDRPLVPSYVLRQYRTWRSAGSRRRRCVSTARRRGRPTRWRAPAEGSDKTRQDASEVSEAPTRDQRPETKHRAIAHRAIAHRSARKRDTRDQERAIRDLGTH